MADITTINASDRVSDSRAVINTNFANLNAALGGGSVGPGTQNELAYFDTTTSIASLAVATYPSLTELSYIKGATSAIQTQLDGKQAVLTGLTSSVAELNILDGATLDVTELNYVDGVTSAIQTQLNAKSPSTSPTFATSITGSYLTASEILITDGSKNIVSAAVATYPSLTELTYMKGVTSAIQTQLNARATSAGALTQFVGNNTWKVFYSDGSGDIIELALGADGTFLKSNGAAVAPTFATPAGSGDVSKVGTPVNNQIGVWTGDGTLEGDVELTFDTSSNILTVPTISTAIVLVSNLLAPAAIEGGTGVETEVTVASQYLSATHTKFHWSTGPVVTTPTADYNYTSVNFMGQTITEAGSGTHALIANLAVGALEITSGAGATTNSATVYIEGPATGTASPTNSYAVWVDDGVTRLDGNLLLSGLTASEIVITDASKNLVSAAVATYPSLTELAYVKGVTSSIQDQINGISGGGISESLAIAYAVAL